MSEVKSYQVTCFEQRPVDEMNADIRAATRAVDILQMDVDSIRRYHFEALHDALRSTPELRVRLLTLDPVSPYIARRAHQLGITFAEQRDHMRRNIRELLSVLDGLDFSLRIYDDYPSQITFSVDDSIYVCTIARNRPQP